MSKSNKFSPEVRERAVRMVQEHRGEYPSLWAAIESIAPKIGCVPQTLNDWVKKAEVDSGHRAGMTSSDDVYIGWLLVSETLDGIVCLALHKASFVDASLAQKQANYIGIH